MRIIAGTHRSRQLETLAGADTRPTQDKIREAIFSSLGTYFESGNILDLFAGSGSVGLEALSRGMHKVYFSDCNKAAIDVIKKNIQSLKAGNECVVEHLDYKAMLTRCKDVVFDVIFIDPPYALKVHEEIITFIEQHNMLSDFGTIVVETHKQDCFAQQYGAYVKTKEKCYGITRITYFRKESL